jgi:hypothetical protein
LISFNVTSYDALTIITFSTWSYFLIYCCLATLLNRWLPVYFPKWKAVLTISVSYCLALILVVSSILAASNAVTMQTIYYALFAFKAVVIGTGLVPWIAQVRKDHIKSKLTLFKWVASLTNDYQCSLAISSGLICLLLCKLLLLIIYPNHPYTPKMELPCWICLELLRNGTALLLHFLFPRGFRSSPLLAERELIANTEFIKFISHEMVSYMLHVTLFFLYLNHIVEKSCECSS